MGQSSTGSSSSRAATCATWLRFSIPLKPRMAAMKLSMFLTGIV